MKGKKYPAGELILILVGLIIGFTMPVVLAIAALN
jgi:hypothetical protein